MAVSRGIAQDATEGNPVLEVGALKAVHEQKVRALMRSIGQLQEQLLALKTQEKEHRRSALIQDLRTQQREQELLIDVLKQTLQEKVAEFQDSRALVNDFVLKKAVGAPLRFRPKTREELENELQTLGQTFQRTVERLRQDNQRNATAKEEKPQLSDDDDDEDNEVEAKAAPFTDNHGDSTAGTYQVSGVTRRLRVELASKSVTIHAQADEIAELCSDLDKLRIVEDQIGRKKHKIALLREQLSRQHTENVELVHEKEAQAEKYLQLQEEVQFLRDINVEDASAKDEERLQQLELVQTLRARELELQGDLEQQQKKWASDRATVHQRLRLLEKEKQLAEDEKNLANAETTALQKKYGVYFKGLSGLEATLAQLESLSREEREVHARATAEKLAALEQLVEDKTAAVKKTDRQLNAAKLLARQAKKEKEQLLLRVSKLETASDASST
ncbi:hypothetical protein BBJ28_00013922 [Nothophytophthora sp. Chile5]|nr:hypothetical protein BBJ28_00013922 [Nothophytophthora sp. Chile5]